MWVHHEPLQEIKSREFKQANSWNWTIFYPCVYITLQVSFMIPASKHAEDVMMY